jgi:hypothetical protein
VRPGFPTIHSQEIDRLARNDHQEGSVSKVKFLSIMLAAAWLASPPAPPAGDMRNGADPNYVATGPEPQALAHKAAMVEQHMASRGDGLT